MKRVFIRTGLLCTIVLLFATCNKIDWDFFRHQAKKNCDVQSYYLTLDHGPAPFLFEKKYNAAGNRITEIVCTFFNVIPLGSALKLRVAYHGLTIYLVNMDNPLDTTMKIYLNSKGRVKECVGTLGIHYTRFYYDANDRLRNVERSFGDGFILNDSCEYDSYGNILSITHSQGSAGRAGNFYQYDYSKKGKRQFYFDEPSTNNDFALAQYLGLFPELEPVHVRTHVRVGLEVGSALWDKYLAHHQFDAKGRLKQYDIVNNSSGTDLSFQAFVNWKCK
jgi:hypothetical protein